jgi:NAD(P)-dependent dehydrogenase (short-subunit alcohol dehydrogenase family)
LFRKEDVSVEIADKVVIITGASEGIGYAAARLFAEHGAKLALVARSEEKLHALAALCPASLAVPADLRAEGSVGQMVDTVARHFGRVDVLINNAGQGMHVPVEQADLSQYRSVFELNVLAPLAAMQAVTPLMRAQGGGVIVNVSSGTTRMTLPGVAPYASTKHALNSLSQTARLELAKDHISVCLVYPGIVDTAFHDHLANGAWHRPQGNWSNNGPRPPIFTAAEVAHALLEAVQTESAEIVMQKQPG